jgi:hypothetical protein
MRLAAKDVPFDPVAVFEGRIPGATGRTRDNARRDRPTDLGHRANASVPASLQIFSVFRRSHRSASPGTGNSTGRDTGTDPASLMRTLVMVMMLHYPMARRRGRGDRRACAAHHQRCGGLGTLIPLGISSGKCYGK